MPTVAHKWKIELVVAEINRGPIQRYHAGLFFHLGHSTRLLSILSLEPDENMWRVLLFWLQLDPTSTSTAVKKAFIGGKTERPQTRLEEKITICWTNSTGCTSCVVCHRADCASLDPSGAEKRLEKIAVPQASSTVPAEAPTRASTVRNGKRKALSRKVDVEELAGIAKKPKVAEEEEEETVAAPICTACSCRPLNQESYGEDDMDYIRRLECMRPGVHINKDALLTQVNRTYATLDQRLDTWYGAMKALPVVQTPRNNIVLSQMGTAPVPFQLPYPTPSKAPSFGVGTLPPQFKFNAQVRPIFFQRYSF